MQVRILPPSMREQGVFASRSPRPGGSRAAIARRSCTRLLSGRGRFDSVRRRLPWTCRPARQGGGLLSRIAGVRIPPGPSTGCRVLGAGCRGRRLERTKTGAGREARRAAVDRAHAGSNPAPRTRASGARGSDRPERSPLKRSGGGSNPSGPVEIAQGPGGFESATPPARREEASHESAICGSAANHKSHMNPSGPAIIWEKPAGLCLSIRGRSITGVRGTENSVVAVRFRPPPPISLDNSRDVR